MIKKTVEYIKIPKRLFIGVLVGLAIVVTLVVLKPDHTLVDVGTVSQGLFQKVIVDEGVTSFKEKHIISAPADGIVSAHTLKAGDSIKKGQKLVPFEWDRNFSLTSPVDGFVLQVFHKDRKHVPRGTPILEVGSPEQVEIVAQILSEEVVNIEVGQKAYISKWGGEKRLDAVVKKIEPSAKEEVSALGVKEQRVNVRLDITTDKKIWKSLGDGFRVEVTIVTKEALEELRVPVGALFSNQGKPAVFLVEKKKIKLQNIEIGDRNREFAELKGPLPADAQLVLYPGSSLKDGDKIKIRQ